MSALAKETQELTPLVSQAIALTPMVMLDRAVSQGASVETLDKLMGLQERWEKNQARKSFDAAIADAKAKLRPVLRNRAGHNSKRYADFAAIATAVDPVLSEFGLSYRFRSEQGEKINVTCILSHKGGHSEETTLSGPADNTGNKNAIQAIGSTLTYLQRYSLVQMLGLAAADDDDGLKSDQSTVTADQAEQLAKIVLECGADINKVLTAFQIESLSDLPAHRFDECVTRLRNAAKRK